MTTVYLVRHAKSVGNTERIFQGRSNLGLSSEGMAQLPQLAERFREIPLDAIYSSPLQRAMQTAEAVNHYHHLPVQTEEGLCEIFAGEWEMKHFPICLCCFRISGASGVKTKHIFVRPTAKALCRYTIA